jgi:toxin-antitoxin system PIN domain toxin
VAKVGLLDVNVLVALIVSSHVHHTYARRWVLTEGQRTGWATCPVTELGAIRVCAQLTVGARSPEATADALIQMRVANRGHIWWADAVSPAVVSEVRRSQTSRQVTDRYLLGLARRYSGLFITFDRAIAQVGGPDAVCLLPSA